MIYIVIFILMLLVIMLISLNKKEQIPTLVEEEIEPVGSVEPIEATSNVRVESNNDKIQKYLNENNSLRLDNKAVVNNAILMKWSVSDLEELIKRLDLSIKEEILLYSSFREYGIFPQKRLLVTPKEMDLQINKDNTLNSRQVLESFGYLILDIIELNNTKKLIEVIY